MVLVRDLYATLFFMLKTMNKILSFLACHNESSYRVLTKLSQTAIRCLTYDGASGCLFSCFPIPKATLKLRINTVEKKHILLPSCGFFSITTNNEKWTLFQADFTNFSSAFVYTHCVVLQVPWQLLGQPVCRGMGATGHETTEGQHPLRLLGHR